MTTEQVNTNEEKLASAARQAVEEGVNVRDHVRELTLEALSRGRLDGPRIKEVVQTVVAGASRGAKEAGDDTKETLGQAFKGVDDALKKGAEAISLSVQEASGRANEFAQADLKSALEDMRTLESMFLDTVKKVAHGADDLVRDVLHDLVGHAERGGTDVGKAAKETSDALAQAVEDKAKAAVDAGGDVGRRLAQAASGFLAGVAKGIDHALEKERDQQNKG